MHSHANEIRYWAEHPDGTKVWLKHQNSDWTLLEDYEINWRLKKGIYIVDDEWAELRIAQADSKQLQYLSFSGKWIDDTLDYNKMTLMLKNWRIKPENPVYEYQVIYRLTNSNVYNLTCEYYKDEEEFKRTSSEFVFVELYEPSKRERNMK